jgi:hypothetical protein
MNGHTETEEGDGSPSGLLELPDYVNPNLDDIFHHSILKIYPRANHSAFLNTLT